MESKRFGVSAVVILCSMAGATAPQTAEGQTAEGAAPAAFDTYWMVFLERPDAAPEFTDEELAEIQKGHLAHLGKVWTDGYALVAGPFDNGEDGKLRGIVLYRGDLGRERVMELAEADPAVQAGRLEVRTLQWFTGAGMLTFQSPPEEAGE